MSEARNVALMPITGLDADSLTSRLEENFRRIAATFQLPLAADDVTSIPAEKVTAGTFGAGNYTFPSALTVNGALTVDNSSAHTLFIGMHPIHTGWATVSRNNQLGTLNYKLLMSDNVSYLNADTELRLLLAGSGSNQLKLTNSLLEITLGGALKFQSTGTTNVSFQNLHIDGYCELDGNNPFKWQDWGGTIHMQDTTWIRVNKSFYQSTGEIRTDGSGFNSGNGLAWASHTVGLYVNKSQLDQYNTKGVRIVNSTGKAGMSCWVQDFGAMNWGVFGAAGNKWRSMNSADSGWIPIQASAFEISSAIGTKSDVRTITGKKRHIKKMRPVAFKRKVRATTCVWCEGTGRVSLAEWAERAGAGENKPGPETPANMHEKQDCPNCTKNGIPGQINTPSIDKNEDTDYLGFIAEEVAEWAPEAIAWIPSDPDDPNSEPIPEAIDLMAMVALLAQEVKDLDERLELIEGVT